MGLSMGSQTVFTRVSEKTTENSEKLGQQARPGFEPGTSRLPVLSVTAMPLAGRPSKDKSNVTNFLTLKKHRIQRIKCFGYNVANIGKTGKTCNELKVINYRV